MDASEKQEIAEIASDVASTKSEASAILAAVQELRSDFAVRFEQLEAKTDAQGKVLETLTAEVAVHHSQIAELAAAQVRTASASSAAAELAAQALAKINTVHDDTRKMVESAMTIQKGAIANAVKEAVQPVSDDVDLLKKSTTAQNEALGEMVNQLGIEDRVSLGREVKPGEKRPEPAFEKLEKRARKSTLLQALVAAGVIAEAIARILHH